MAATNVSETASRQPPGTHRRANNRAFYYVDGIPTRGCWVDLDAIAGIDEVLARLADAGLDRIDQDDHLMVADVEGDLARAFYESRFDAFPLGDFIDCRDQCSDEAVAAAFIEWYGSWSPEVCEDAYQGVFDSETAFAELLIEDCGLLDGVPETISAYFDYERFSNDLFITDYYLAPGGFVFNRNV